VPGSVALGALGDLLEARTDAQVADVLAHMRRRWPHGRGVPVRPVHEDHQIGVLTIDDILEAAITPEKRRMRG
jgi:hypothetical protein